MLKVTIPGARHLPSFFVPIPGHLASLCVPTLGNLSIILNKCYCPGVSPGAGGMGTVGIDWRIRLGKFSLHYSLDSDGDFRSGCRNISHQQQIFSELPSPGRSHDTNYKLYNFKLWYDRLTGPRFFLAELGCNFIMSFCLVSGCPSLVSCLLHSIAFVHLLTVHHKENEKSVQRSAVLSFHFRPV